MPTLSQSSSPSIPIQDATNTRKRQRSQSMQSEPSSSSPKRSVSDDSSQDVLRASHSQDTPAPSDQAQSLDIDAYMAEQGDDPPSTNPKSTLTPAQKLSVVEPRWKAPMRVGDTYYVVSRAWFERWRKACSGEVDKQGPLEEKDIGPVDNSAIVVGDEGVLDTNVGPDDLEFVPESVWGWFIEWYGQPRIALPRKVIARGIQGEPSLELHPPKVRTHILVAQPAPGIQVVPRTTTVSVKDTMEDVRKKVVASLPVNETIPYRVWRLADGSASGHLSLSCTPEQLKELGATLLEPSEKTVEDELIESGDAFVVEPQQDGSWAVDEKDVPAHSGTASTSTSQSTIKGTTPKLFGGENDFFTQVQSKASPSTANASTFPGQKPSTSSKSGVLATTTRSKGSSQEPGTLGLGNMGNTCFMNSALQCLAHTQELTEYFLTGVFEEELNFDNPLGMQGAIAQTFGALLRRIWTPGSTGSSYAPREFKQALQRFAPQFSGYQQHDSQELVAFLLDGLHEDLNRVRQKPYVEKPDWEGGGEKELAELANASWEGYMKRNDSVIVDLFQGQYQSTLVCPECSKVSITFDPFMYLTLPLPVQKKWRHTVFYVPWDLEKQPVKVPVEINRDASFKDLRQLLGRWMDADPEHLLTVELFSHRVYKDLDDTVLVSDMGDSDVIACFELPCHSQQSRTYKPQPDDPFIVPVFFYDAPSTRQTFRNQNLFGNPFMVVIDRKQATDPDAMYDAVADRLQQWTTNVRDLFTWEPATPSLTEPVRIPISGPRAVESVTEIKENGDIVTVEEPAPEEGDITDEKATVVREQDDSDMVTEISEELRRIGFKKGIFKLRVQPGNSKYGAGYGSYNASSQRYESWEYRMLQKKDDSDPSSPPVLLQENDVLLLEIDENMKAYYFGDVDDRPRWDNSKWPEFVHPEYAASRKASAMKKDQGISLQDCLDEFTREEKLGEDDLWYCPRCKKHQQATKRFDLWKVPDVLVVHLKRFSNSRMLRDKIDKFVDFPVTGLDISEMVGERKVAKKLVDQGVDPAQLGLSNLDEPLVYDLFAVDEHLGGLGGGHYRAYAYNHITDKWYHFDDSYVTSVNPESAVNSNAYLLFYRRRSTRPLGGKSHAKIVEASRIDHNSMSESAPAAQLPTPPLETAGNQAGRQLLPTLISDRLNSLYESGPRTDGWVPVSRSSPASSLPPLDDGEPPSFEESQYDEVLQQPSLDPLVLSAHQFDFPDPSITDSPTSSTEAEPDLPMEEVSDDQDDQPRGKQWRSGNFPFSLETQHQNSDFDTRQGTSSPSLDYWHSGSPRLHSFETNVDPILSTPETPESEIDVQ